MQEEAGKGVRVSRGRSVNRNRVGLLLAYPTSQALQVTYKKTRKKHKKRKNRDKNNEIKNVPKVSDN